MKPIAVELDYPSLDGIKENRQIAEIIAPSFAGSKGELNAILSYTYHGFYFEKENYDTIKDTLEGIAIAEMKHLEILGNLLLKLGRDPGFYTLGTFDKKYYSTENVVVSKTPLKMLYDDLSGEMLAVDEYKKVIECVNDEKIIEIISRIKLDEELHIAVLKDAINSLK